MQSVTKLITLSFVATSALFAAQPTIGDVERQVQPPNEVQEGMNNVIPPIPSEPLKEPMIEESGKQIEVKGFKFSGVFHMSKEHLLSIVQPYAGKNHSFAELQKMTSLITKAYREKGYFIARAYLPKQHIKDGILEIAVIEGSYGAFHLKNSSLVSDKHLEAIFEDMQDDNIVSVSTLERAMLLINDTPGVQVTGVDVKPGQAIGTSDFDITTKTTNPYNAYIVGDNYGSKYTGRYRVNVGASANSPLGYGDKLGMNGVISTTSDLENGKLYYNFPLMTNGLRGELSAARTNYSLAEEYDALDALGNSTTLEASLIYPLIRTRLETLHLSLGYAHKEMKDEVRSTSDVTKKDSDLLNLNLAYRKDSLFFGLESVTNATVTLTRGELSFNDAADLAADQAGAKTNGDYTKIGGSLEKSIQFSPRFALTTNLQFQKALGNKNLDGSEDFSLGGAYNIRAFPDGEHSAENGYIIGMELLYTLPNIDGITHKVGIFADTGYAKMENSTGATEPRQLSDMGVSYQAFYKQFFTKAQVAKVIGGEKVESESEYSTRLLLQIGYIY